ncbi:galectin [Laccaria bicolor S238N-H82]|uniref:Galectin n=1 Tax=Laccaria bicolor (strain S238N-H82 / ATCC MYA-4686) TaxID=486041 RepID=B0DI25_LACBS|nr:galectin [Laccaria bicolor S238N-H82]EDR05834.1 galectin [Laccaria bicolor S238N-H82]|eukprot:XP_001883510.1 galectin [Laccaria bicolor S238N-H82]
MSYHLPVHQTVALKKEFKVENIIVFRSTKLDLTPSFGPGIDNTSVNIMSAADDYLLHINISFRRAQKAIVFNSKRANRSWGPEERVTLEGLFLNGLHTTITVYDHGDRFQVLIDYKTIHYYVKRFHKNGAAVLYKYNTNFSVFSETLDVTMYDSFANIRVIPSCA